MNDELRRLVAFCDVVDAIDARRKMLLSEAAVMIEPIVRHVHEHPELDDDEWAEISVHSIRNLRALYDKILAEFPDIEATFVDSFRQA